MRTYKDAKAMAKSLRELLAIRNVSVSHSDCLEIVAQQFGFADWNTLSSKLSNEETRPGSKDQDAALRTGDMPQTAGTFTERLPVMPLRDVVVYPGIVMPIFAGRAKTIHAAETAMSGDKRVVLVMQRQPNIDQPTVKDLFQVGTVATVLEEWALRKTAEPSGVDMLLVSNIPGVTHKIMVKGIARARLDIVDSEDYLSAQVTVLNDTQTQNVADLDSLRKTVITRFQQYIEASGGPAKIWKGPPEPPALADILRWFGSFDIGRFADMIAAHTPLRLAQKQEVLESLDVRKRLERVDAATKELEQADITSKK
jgi:ATP-dependent Lon protease